MVQALGEGLRESGVDVDVRNCEDCDSLESLKRALLSLRPFPLSSASSLLNASSLLESLFPESMDSFSESPGICFLLLVFSGVSGESLTNFDRRFELMSLHTVFLPQAPLRPDPSRFFRFSCTQPSPERLFFVSLVVERLRASSDSFLLNSLLL